MINKARNQLGNRVVGEIKHQGRELRALKQAQLLGGDNLVKEVSDLVSVSLTIAAGAGLSLNIEQTPDTARLLLREPQWTLYIGTDHNLDYLWPTGDLLTSNEKLKTRVNLHRDWALSNNTSGLAYTIVQIINETAGPLDYFFHLQFINDKVGIAS